MLIQQWVNGESQSFDTCFILAWFFLLIMGIPPKNCPLPPSSALLLTPAQVFPIASYSFLPQYQHSVKAKETELLSEVFGKPSDLCLSVCTNPHASLFLLTEPPEKTCGFNITSSF